MTCHTMQCILCRIIFGRVFICTTNLICTLYALLCWRNFILVKGGCYKPTPLKESRPRDSRSTREEFETICSELFFVLPGSFILRVVTPLNFAHLNNLITSHSLCHIQNLNQPLTVCQITSQVKLFHEQLLLWDSQTFLEL
jgi:hypothetical protein